MTIIMSMINKLLTSTWFEVGEISCFIGIAYSILTWLNTDPCRNLVAYGCMIYITIYSAWVLHFKALTIALLWGLPIIIMCVVVVHQKYIQRQYLALRTVHTATFGINAWCDELIKQTLIMMHHNHPVTWYIENTHALDTFLYAEGTLYATMTTSFIEFIMKGVSAAEPLHLWIRANGPIRGIQPHIHINEEQYLMDTDCALLPPWQRKMLILSHCTDALIMHGNPLQRTCTMYVQGKIIEQLTPHHAISLLKHHFEGVTMRSKDTTWKNDLVHGSFVVHGHAQSGRSSSDTPPGL